MQQALPYIGRFAPSPSGPLHLGSLSCALVSYLHAKQAGGKWLVRMEDVDTTRVMPNADSTILHQLEAHGLHWDNSVVYQTQRQEAYQSALASLQAKQLVYACDCTRQTIKAKGRYYTSYCQHRNLSDTGNALRLIIKNNQASFDDLLLGRVTVEPEFCNEDLVLKRKDGLFAYNLAVVVDDIYQGVTHVVRGADLIDTTPQQNYLYGLLQSAPPQYLHFPVLSRAPGKKLSKQNHAKAVSTEDTCQTLSAALAYIGLAREKQLATQDPSELLQWAITHWSPKLLSKQREILISDVNEV